MNNNFEQAAVEPVRGERGGMLYVCMRIANCSLLNSHSHGRFISEPLCLFRFLRSNTAYGLSGICASSAPYNVYIMGMGLMTSILVSSQLVPIFI